jgi:hypothetical protein
MTDQVAVTEEVAAPSEVDQMGAIWDKLQDAPETPAEAEPVEAVAEPAKVEEAPSLAEIEAPTDLPAGLKSKWATIPEDARDAVLASHRDLSRKLADQGRVTQASKPVYDVLVQAAREIPTMQDMTPAQIAQDVFQMAKVQGMLQTDPVGTLLQIAMEHGAVDGIRARLGGVAPDAAAQQNMQLTRQLADLQAKLDRLADPALVDQRVEQTLTQREVSRTVEEYAATKEHWSAVEEILPPFIEMARQTKGDGTSAKDILDAAYDMAIHAIPELRAKVSAATAPVTDPQLTAAQLKAKSVNVTSRPSGQGRSLSEKEQMAAIWDKHRAS